MAECTITPSQARALAILASDFAKATCDTKLEDCGFLSEASRRTYGRKVQRLLRKTYDCGVKMKDLPLDGDTSLCDVGDAVYEKCFKS